MEIQVQYFGEIAEWKSCKQETKQMEEDATTEVLVKQLLVEIPQLEQINFAVAVNQKMIDSSVALVNGCEVSVFPPFAGG